MYVDSTQIEYAKMIPTTQGLFINPWLRIWRNVYAYTTFDFGRKYLIDSDVLFTNNSTAEITINRKIVCLVEKYTI